MSRAGTTFQSRPEVHRVGSIVLLDLMLLVPPTAIHSRSCLEATSDIRMVQDTFDAQQK
jgi:hypothetical protein